MRNLNTENNAKPISPVKYNFERHETKFLLKPEQYRKLIALLADKMTEDEYGVYSISSIYYDTDNYDLIRRSLEKPAYKEKFRLRSYGTPGDDGMVFAEIKKKLNGITYKRRIDGTPDGILAFVSGTEEDGDVTGSVQIQKEIKNLLSRYKLSPKVYIGYERLALAGKEDPELRITFDWNIRWRTTHLDLREGDAGQLLLPDDRVVMEIKTINAIPLWLTQLLSELKIYSQGFSKYGTCYTKNLAGKRFAPVKLPAKKEGRKNETERSTRYA